MMNSPPAPTRSGATLRTLALCIMTACAALLAACDDDDSPTAPENMLVFEGRLTFASTVEHDFTPRREGTTRMVLTDITPILVDASLFDPASLALSFALGRRVGGECQPTAQLGIREGDVQFFALVESVNYCIVLGDPGIFP